MDATYKMIAGDGQQYGPVTFEQFKAWVAEGRVLPETKVLRSDSQSWLNAWQYTELGLAQPMSLSSPPALPGTIGAGGTPLSTTRPVSPSLTVDPVTVARARNGARWFYWIAGFSAVNALLYASSGSYFLVGLGVSLLTAHTPAIGLGAAALLAALGFFASKHQSWAFIVGMVLYALDALIFLMFSQWLAIAFHGYVIFRLFIGLKSNLELNGVLNRGNV